MKQLRRRIQKLGPKRLLDRRPIPLLPHHHKPPRLLNLPIIQHNPNRHIQQPIRNLDPLLPHILNLPNRLLKQPISQQSRNNHIMPAIRQIEPPILHVRQDLVAEKVVRVYGEGFEHSMAAGHVEIDAHFAHFVQDFADFAGGAVFGADEAVEHGCIEVGVRALAAVFDQNLDDVHRLLVSAGGGFESQAVI